jgi:hypothetical protein
MSSAARSLFSSRIVASHFEANGVNKFVEVIDSTVIEAVKLRSPSTVVDDGRHSSRCCFVAAGTHTLHGRSFSHDDGPKSSLWRSSMKAWPTGNSRITVLPSLVACGIHKQGLERQATPHVHSWYRQAGNATSNILGQTSGNLNALTATL